VAGVERRMRVVLDVQLDRLGDLPAGDLTGKPQAEVDADRDAGRGGDQHPAVGDDRSGSRADEAHLGVGQQPQDLVGPDGIQGGQPRIEHDGDLHDRILVKRQPAGRRQCCSG
jgi:hypothetical protein